ncbi:YiiX/YebB-like N1pC/P60 family cysteine hydrolase [Algoriphagus litoralis]|uniref:YiiX/YebB-like N1pC/P60 family cysteine hydrolase n=1 Tax=Algoriphagus litoralis TaxID=2202829 RepID=UPI000DBA749F|nr:YiiX/YebB-like N1pC/P60 family cysteine hydrolase [Algoriphagus litoralis]
MKKLLKLIAINLYLFLFFVLPAHAQEKVSFYNLRIQTGDLIFVGAKQDQLSGAINRVTQREENASFDHVGIIEVSETGIYILHASPEKGSVREPLDSLVNQSKSKNKKLAVYRLAKEVQPSISGAIISAKTLLGKPYNWSYVLNDTSLYCSDFVERAFRDAKIFELEPMTFKDPKTGEIDTYWAEFYTKLGMEVPEGKAGCNPNGLAGSRHLVRLGKLYEK